MNLYLSRKKNTEYNQQPTNLTFMTDECCEYLLNGCDGSENQRSKSSFFRPWIWPQKLRNLQFHDTASEVKNLQWNIVTKKKILKEISIRTYLK